MFDGKMLRELAGIPMRKTDFGRTKRVGALAEPDPLTLAEFDDEVVDAFWMLGRLDPSTFIPLEFRCGLVPLEQLAVAAAGLVPAIHVLLRWCEYDRRKIVDARPVRARG